MEPLSAVFEKLTDFRQRSGQRHALGTTLTIIFLAILSGENGLREIARWSQEQRAALVERFQLKRGQVPSYGTIRRVLGGLDVNELESQLNRWASTALSAQGLQAWTGVAMDGKKLRHSAEPGQTVLQLLSAFSHELSVVLAQQAVQNKTNEIPAARQLLEQLAIEGKVVTVDALHTQRQTAQAIVDKKGPI